MGSTQNHAEGISVPRLWPPSEEARSGLVRFLVNNLVLESLSSGRHGHFSKEKAGEYAKQIESISFSITNHYASICLDFDGSIRAEFYARETGKLLLDYLEQGPPAEEENSNLREALPEIVEMKETDFDLSTGGRRLLDIDLATELFMPLKDSGNSFTKIRFGNKSFGLEAAHIAKGVLMGVQKTLKDVELVDFFFLRPEAEALEVMSILSSAFTGCVLRSLKLELGLFGEKGLRAFEPLLKSQKMLEEMKFKNTTISGEFVRALCEFLPSIERIKCLHFSGNCLGDDAAEKVSELVEKCIALEDFKFTESCLGTRGAEALLGALRQGSGLKKLNLSLQWSWSICGLALSRVIPRHPGLCEIYLDNMCLADEGVIYIANSLIDSAPSLRVLTVIGNDITPKAAPALEKCLAGKSKLAIFNARDNNLEDEGALLVCKAISEGHEQLKELDLSSNHMTLIAAQAAAEAVANKPDFGHLFISGNLFSENECETVREVLRKGTKGDSVLPVVFGRRFR